VVTLIRRGFINAATIKDLKGPTVTRRLRRFADPGVLLRALVANRRQMRSANGRAGACAQARRSHPSVVGLREQGPASLPRLLTCVCVRRVCSRCVRRRKACGHIPTLARRRRDSIARLLCWTGQWPQEGDLTNGQIGCPWSCRRRPVAPHPLHVNATGKRGTQCGQCRQDHPQSARPITAVVDYVLLSSPRFDQRTVALGRGPSGTPCDYLRVRRLPRINP